MLMMPARNDCPSGWTEECHGYLMTEYWKHPNQRDYICVDEDAECVPSTVTHHPRWPGYCSEISPGAGSQSKDCIFR